MTGALAAMTTCGQVSSLPTLMARPDAKLVSGKVISIEGSNWPADDTHLVAWECDSSAHPSSPAYCDADGALPDSSNGKGNLRYRAFTVTTGAVGDGTCGTGSADKVCYIAIYDTADPTVHGIGKIVFKVPAG